MLKLAFLLFFVFFTVNSHEENCAICLPTGHARPKKALSGSSSFQGYFLNSIVGPFRSSSFCLSYADIETAFFLASSRKGPTYHLPAGRNWEPEDVKEIGELLLEVTSILAKKYALSPDSVYRFLSQIDVTKTSILGICPPFAAPLKCSAGRYRRFDGLCNNLQHPTWGATRAVFQRLIPPVYEDGVSSPRVTGVGGCPLPSARLVSATVHRDEGFHDHAASLLLVAWGQLMDHDFTLTATPLDPLNRNEPEECCDRPPFLKNEYCFEIPIPKNDKFYDLFGTKCLDFVRGFPGVRQNCHLGPREQFNILTGVIDGNTIYGGSEDSARELRSMTGGKLREHHAFNTEGLKPVLPLKMDIPDEGCMRGGTDEFCFLAGEIRVNEQLILTCIHTLMMREHNRIAKELQNLNPHWEDERLYQEARHIVAAEIQHVTFNEFLPQLLGSSIMKEFGLMLNKEGYWDGYDPKVDPSMTSAFVTSAFRFGHSLLPSTIERWSPNYKFIGSKRLSTLIRQPFDLHRAGWVDEYFMGMMIQPAQAMDDSITQEVTNHLFQDSTERFGFDLVAFNLQRAREFGVPGYNAFRKFCNLRPAKSFKDLALFMTNSTAARYEKVYRHVDDIDLWSGGVSERPKAGSLLGPTFSCIIGHQMAKLRKGDRFWYELPNQPSSFTLDQLKEIKKVRLSRLICDNSDRIHSIQMYPLVLHDYDINRRVSCKSGIIPHLDLSPWADINFTENDASYYTTKINDYEKDFNILSNFPTGYFK